MRFTGKERDAETGLDFFLARYFSSAQGRFTSPDEPLVDQHTRDPQSWNLYSYVRNNPLAFTDPSGQDCVYTNNYNTDGTVTVETGNCSQKGGTFVNGTIDTKSLTVHNGSLEFGYTDPNGGAGVHSLGLPSAPTSSDIFINEMSRRRDASNQMIALFAGGSALVGATGGVACYYGCAAVAELFAGTITNAEAGGVIGWGTGQGGAGATRALARGLTRAAVEQMKRQGLTKNTVKQLLQKYEQAAIKAAQNGTTNTQLPERLELMKKILSLW
ncbi:MAG: RHS repeat-associated core domain-containing protein [Acidobacteriota bacterium]